MNKIFTTFDLQDELLEALDGVTMTYFDSDTNIKSAASSVVSREMMDQLVPDDKHFAVHLVALGAGEKYGFNKNGDDWPEKGLAHTTDDYGMHTFEKYGHHFREHRNSNPGLKIGDVKAAFYNPKMARGELIIWGDKDKAEKEYREAKSGKQLSFSMSAKVPGDNCSICEHFAKRSSAYCPHLRYHMTQWMPKFGKFAYARNDRPKFFDISSVENPADRIAHHLEIRFSPDDETKSASTNFMFSDIKAEQAGILLPDDQFGCMSPVRQRWLEKLAAVEKYVQEEAAHGNDARAQFLKSASEYAFDSSAFTEAQLDALRKNEPGVVFNYMAKKSAVIPFLPFFAYTTNQSLKQAAEDPAYQYAKEKLCGSLFRDLVTAPADYDVEQMFLPASSIKMAAAHMDSSDAVMDAIAEDNTIEPNKVKFRMLKICAANTGPSAQTKTASVAADEAAIQKAKVVAKAYAFYKVAFCEAVVDAGSMENVDDAALLLITSQHS